MDRQMDELMNGWADKETQEYRWTDENTERSVGRQKDKHTDWQKRGELINKDIYRWTDRQAKHKQWIYR